MLDVLRASRASAQRLPPGRAAPRYPAPVAVSSEPCGSEVAKSLAARYALAAVGRVSHPDSLSSVRLAPAGTSRAYQAPDTLTGVRARVTVMLLGAVLVAGVANAAASDGSRIGPRSPAARTSVVRRSPPTRSPHALQGVRDPVRPAARGDGRGRGYLERDRLRGAREVAPFLARGRPNLVVFDEDLGLETLAIGPRAAAARRAAPHGVPACRRQTVPSVRRSRRWPRSNGGYGRRCTYLERRFPSLRGELGRSFVAGDRRVRPRVHGDDGAVARRYGVYVIASNTQAPFR